MKVTKRNAFLAGFQGVQSGHKTLRPEMWACLSQILHTGIISVPCVICNASQASLALKGIDPMLWKARPNETMPLAMEFIPIIQRQKIQKDRTSPLNPKQVTGQMMSHAGLQNSPLRLTSDSVTKRSDSVTTSMIR